MEEYTNYLTMLSLDELTALQDVLNEEIKLSTKRLNNYSVYETSYSLDNDTVSRIIGAGAMIKYLKLLADKITRLIENKEK